MLTYIHGGQTFPRICLIILHSNIEMTGLWQRKWYQECMATNVHSSWVQNLGSWMPGWGFSIRFCFLGGGWAVGIISILECPCRICVCPRKDCLSFGIWIPKHPSVLSCLFVWVFFNLYFMWMGILPTCVSVHHVFVRSPGSGVVVSCKLPYGCWELNPSLTSAPPLVPFCFFVTFLRGENL